ncbi:MAG: tRNA preQ1(34) S-adenosylmethionine ribosyltransferase-isomerase QueA [Deltaproteobacteria bacterium]|nr:tRNA preQ1(34) S-adenosylmethionine ribosyltransferase-isomerase QueA [Deltaproteobacteria bacterium]
MQLSEFHYDLPQSLIAQAPLSQRDASRLLVLDRKKDKLVDCDFYDIHHFFEEGDCLVINDAKVIPARFFGFYASGGKAEVLLLQEISEKNWKCLIRASKRNRIGEIIKIADDFVGEIVALHEELPIIRFYYSKSWDEVVRLYGSIPLPPYIERMSDKIDEERYQTIFAKNSGAIAAPTAGLHFTQRVIKLIENKGVSVIPITLHVSYGTFQPVRVENILEHRMHGEYFSVSHDAAVAINRAKRVIAVGTTSARCLESSWVRGEVRPQEGLTHLYIYPPYHFKAVTSMVTNFHQPRSTLLMLVAAFTGLERIQKAYKHAIEKEYRFFSYGDAMLIL